MRTCRTCQEVKALDDFPIQRKGGFRGTENVTYRLDCKTCVASAAREYRKTYVPKGKKVHTLQGVDKYLMSAIRCRVADARGRATRVHPCDFNITPEYMLELWQAQHGKCSLSGIPMSLDKGTPHVLSIDKIIPAGGYTLGNVQWVSWAVNRAKGDLTHAEFMHMCRAIVEGATTIP